MFLWPYRKMSLEVIGLMTLPEAKWTPDSCYSPLDSEMAKFKAKFCFEISSIKTYFSSWNLLIMSGEQSSEWGSVIAPRYKQRAAGIGSTVLVVTRSQAHKQGTVWRGVTHHYLLKSLKVSEMQAGAGFSSFSLSIAKKVTCRLVLAVCCIKAPRLTESWNVAAALTPSFLDFARSLSCPSF